MAVVGVRRVLSTAKTLAALGALQATLPLNAVILTHSLLRQALSAPAAPPASTGRTVLLSGGKMTKSLALARHFHAAGHRVVLAETSRYRFTAHRFSRAVESFHVLPDSTDPQYAEALLKLVRSVEVDVYVPVCSPASSVGDAAAKETLEAAGCEVVHLDHADLTTVDDKASFSEAARLLGLSVPDSHRITEAQQVLDFDFSSRPRPYILKSIPYDPVRRLDLTLLPLPSRAETERFVNTLPISPAQPWILQEFIEGTEYCTHGTARGGRLQVWVCCESSPWQLTYEMVEHPVLRTWVEKFVAGLGLTGQVSFDFIETDDGTVYAIECNPRTHSAITLLHDDPRVAEAYLTTHASSVPAVEPPVGGAPTFWTYHEVWQGLRHPSQLPSRLRTLRRGVDAIYDPSDPWPFFMLTHLHIPSLLVGNLLSGRPWTKVDFNIGKLVEPGGD